jgi:GTP-binding protein HflX
LLHVVDISHRGFEEQIETVNNTLTDIEAGDKPTIYIFNKIDAFSYVEKDDDDLSPKTKENFSLEEWQNSWMAKNNTPSLFISAKEKENIEDFKTLLYNEVKKIHSQRFPFNDYLFDITDSEE